MRSTSKALAVQIPGVFSAWRRNAAATAGAGLLLQGISGPFALRCVITFGMHLVSVLFAPTTVGVLGAVRGKQRYARRGAEHSAPVDGVRHPPGTGMTFMVAAATSDDSSLGINP